MQHHAGPYRNIGERAGHGHTSLGMGGEMFQWEAGGKDKRVIHKINGGINRQLRANFWFISNIMEKINHQIS